MPQSTNLRESSSPSSPGSIVAIYFALHQSILARNSPSRLRRYSACFGPCRDRQRHGSVWNCRCRNVAARSCRRPLGGLSGLAEPDFIPAVRVVAGKLIPTGDPGFRPLPPYSVSLRNRPGRHCDDRPMFVFACRGRRLLGAGSSARNTLLHKDDPKKINLCLIGGCARRRSCSRPIGNRKMRKSAERIARFCVSATHRQREHRRQATVPSNYTPSNRTTMTPAVSCARQKQRGIQR